MSSTVPRPHERRHVGGGGQDAEGTAEQRDRGQDGDVFAELHVDGRLAAPQQGIVHARHVVEDERRRMDDLHRAGHVHQCRRHAAEVARHQHQQQRAHALAGAQGACAHGGIQLVLLAVGIRQPIGDPVFEGAPERVEFFRRGEALAGIESFIPRCLCRHSTFPSHAGLRN
jgi:hypothetical protein